jgi:hypothetical protein
MPGMEFSGYKLRYPQEVKQAVLQASHDSVSVDAPLAWGASMVVNTRNWVLHESAEADMRKGTVLGITVASVDGANDAVFRTVLFGMNGWSDESKADIETKGQDLMIQTSAQSDNMAPATLRHGRAVRGIFRQRPKGGGVLGVVIVGTYEPTIEPGWIPTISKERMSVRLRDQLEQSQGLLPVDKLYRSYFALKSGVRKHHAPTVLVDAPFEARF